MALTTQLFRRMLREEWRLQQQLFGGRRFAAFPLAIALITAGGFALLGFTPTPFADVLAGLHGLVFFFGLQVGTIGLVGRDALRDVLGDLTLLVFSARTLPVSWNRLLAVFLAKDLVYYTSFFIAPIAVALVPAALDAGLAPGRIALVWVTLVATFALGVASSLTLAGLATRSRLAVIATVVAGGAAAAIGAVDPVAFTPYALLGDPTPIGIVQALAPLGAAAVLGPLLFRPARETTHRTAPNRFPQLRSLLRDEHGLVTRSLLDVVRSGGSVTKVLFSMGVLFAVTALLLRQITAATGLTPSPGIAFGALLGLGAFTTYSWVTQYDAPTEYLRYPVPLDAVFAAKRRTYLLLSVPAGLVYLGVAALWYPPRTLAVGAVVLPLVALYVFGVSAYSTGFSPTELLFDTPRFLAFGAALAAVAVPLLVAALVEPLAPTEITAGAVGLSLLAAGVGHALARRAGPRWHEQLRQ